jgi:diguanylate cyclase (GGDEF)-like protein/PAS domain S-box-containing protein
MPAYYFRLLIAAAGIVMLRIWNCLETQHDWRLVLLAGCICFLSCLAAANLFQRARASESRSRAVWLLAAGLMTGCGAWATHFIAMLAYTPGFTISYDLTVTIFSLGVAIIVITGGFVVALVVGARWAGLAGGALAGIGVACMHYMGMASLRIPAEIIWMPDLVTASVVLGILFGAVALHVVRTSDTPLKAVSAACLLTFAILSHHLVAMSAIGLIRQSAPGDEVDLMSPVALSLAIAAFIAVVVVAGLAGAISDRRIRRKTSERNIQLDAALNNMSQGLCMFGPDNRLQLWNERYVTMYRLPSAKMRVGMTVDDLCEVRDAAGTGFEDMDTYRTELRAAMDNQAAGAGCIEEVRDGRTISVIYQPMPNGGWVVTHEDVTEREGAKRDLERTRSFLDTIIENVPSAIMVKEFPDLRYALINQAGERHLGIDRQSILGKCASDVLPAAMARAIDARDRQVLASEAGSVSQEYKFDSLTGDHRVVIAKRIALKDAAGEVKYLVSTIHDISERKQSEARIAHLALHDPLTDLPNRASFNDHLARTFDDASSGQTSFAILCVDLDRFKEVNDVFGHSVGDLFLCEVARRITAACDGAFVARLGGDEFTIVSSAGPQPATAERIAARLMAAFDDEFRLNDHAIHASCTIGISVYPQDGADVETLIANADVALYRAKAEERGTIRFFEAAMDQQIREKRILQRDLATALENGEFELYFQPQAATKGDIVGFEVLARWRHPERGFISPGIFIPLAEEAGLIGAIDEWVLREACREAASWPNPLSIAVNLSPVDFRRGDVPAMILSILLETGLNPHRLEIEITEGVLIEDFGRATSILRKIKNLGVHVAMDDFGTGYSSLSYLQSFPFDRIKIDQAFIARLENNAQSAAIIQAILGLGRSLKLPVIAEGVETSAQLAFLAEAGCNEVQGYLIGRPQPIAYYRGVVAGVVGGVTPVAVAS